MKQFFQKRVLAPILQLLTQGITPEKIALSLAFGFMLGIFPVLETTSLLCLIAAILFRLNLPAVQLVNLLVNPLWFVLLIPFIRMGEQLFGVPHLGMTGTQILALAHANFLHCVRARADHAARRGGVAARLALRESWRFIWSFYP